MAEQILGNWQFLVCALIVVGYFETAQRLSRRYEARRNISDEDYLMVLARSGGTSEYEIFRTSAEQWPVSPYRFKQDFNQYLNGDPMPFYVRDFIRRDSQANPRRGTANPHLYPF